MEDAVSSKLASVLNVNKTELGITVRKNIDAETHSKADYLVYLVHCMKEKLRISNRRHGLQILIFVPNSWSIRKNADVFSVSKGTIQRENDFCATRKEYQNTLISQQLRIIDAIRSFYCDY